MTVVTRLVVPGGLSVDDPCCLIAGGDMKRRVEPGMFCVFVGPLAVEGLAGRFEVLAQ